MDAVKMFNEKLKEFVDDLRPLLAHIPEYALMSSSVKYLGSFEPGKTIQIFRQYVAVPYGDKIKDKDEAFFLETLTIAGADGAASDGMGGIMSMLRGVWRTQLQDADKAAIWTHLQVLLVLCNRATAAAGSASGAGRA